MGYIDMSITDIKNHSDFMASIKAHKRTLLEADWKAQSLENGFPIMQTQAVQDVLKQVDDNAESFYTAPRTEQVISGWLAYGADYDADPNSRCIVGKGSTEQEAIEDYKIQFCERNWSPTGNYCLSPECDLCRDDKNTEREEYLAAEKRAADVAAFFRDFDLLHSDSDNDEYMIERERELGITQADWQAYRERRAAKDAALMETF